MPASLNWRVMAWLRWPRAGHWLDQIVAPVAAYVISTPAGISGAVLLLPFQVSVLGTPSPSVTPTNLLYNVISTPGALYRYWRQRQTGGWPWCSPPGPCLASSPDRSSAPG